MISSTHNYWLPAATAPRNGHLFIADFGSPWPVLCSWNKPSHSWAIADFNVGMLAGEWIDTYFETEWEKPKSLVSWMMLPHPRPVQIKMKLIEILKQKFDKWPIESGQSIVQDIDGWLYASDEVFIENGGWKIKHPVCFGQMSIAKDFNTAIITEADFLAG